MLARGSERREEKGGKRREMYYVVFTVVVIGATIMAVALLGFALLDASVREKKKAKRRVGSVGRRRYAIWVR
jgi:hypothetical protein